MRFSSYFMQSFQYFMTSLLALEPSNVDVPEKVNITALGLGIAIAIVAILLAALLAAVCVRRKGSFTRFGHQSLDTSFENPVYEYEQSMK